MYPSKLAAADIEHRTPTVSRRERINRVIHEELLYARLLSSALAYFQGVINDLKKNSCNAVAQARTEIPLLVTDTESEFPILGSTHIVARAAQRKAISD